MPVGSDSRAPLFVRWPRWTLLVAVGAALLAGHFARSITVDTAPATLLPAGDVERSYWDQVVREFGGDAAIVIGVFGDDVFAPPTLAKIDRLTARLRQLDGVADVRSLTALDGARELPQSDEQAAALRAAVSAHPLARKMLVAADGRSTAIAVRLRGSEIETGGARRLDAQIRELVASVGGPEQFAVAGLPVQVAAAARALEKDLVTMIAGALACALILAALVLRSVRGVAVASLILMVGLAWMLGAMALVGLPITLSTVVAPPVILVIGLAYPLVLAARCERNASSNGARAGAIAVQMRQPFAVATLVCIAGVSGLFFSAIPVARQFGLCVAIGAGSMLLASLTVGPALLAVWPRRALRKGTAHAPGAVARRLERIGVQTMRYRSVLIAVGVAAGIASAVGISRIRVETAYGRFLSPVDRDRAGEALIAKRLGGTETITLAVGGYTPGAISRIETLRALLDLQRFVAGQRGVVAVISLIDYLAGEVPATQAEVDALLRRDSGASAVLVTEDFSRARVIVRTRMSSSAEVLDFVRRVDGFASPKLLHRGFGARALFPRGVTVRATGTAVLLGRAAPRLVAEQRALGWVTAALLVLVSILFLSLRVGAAIVLLNAGAGFVAYGLMGWSGVSLDSVSGCLGALVLSAAASHTVHYMSGCSALAGEPGCPPDALAGVVESMGPPIGFAAVALAAGFLVLAASHVPPVRWVGYLGSAALSLALIANVLLLATRVLTRRIITIGDVLFRTIGRLEEIPLFAGLRPFQAKIVVLSGRLAAAKPGDFITRRGETKPELYVLLSGRAEVRPGDGSAAAVTLTRGDVIGEMGMVRELPRSADVVAREDTEYLVLDGGFLDRLRRHYPRLAAAVLLNLTRILSDRLERTSARMMRVMNAE